jgi:glycosyltransferase involved in cell wall biosynthesis
MMDTDSQKGKVVVIDYVVPYALRKADGRANSLVCKLRYLAEMRDGSRFRLFAPYRDCRLDLPENVEVISQAYLTIRILQELFLNVVYAYYLLKKRPDCLIVRPDALFMGHFLAKLMKVCVILNIHSYPKDEYGHVYRSLIGRIFTRIVHTIFFLSMKCADGIIFNHPNLREYVTRRHSYRRSATSIYNGADTSRFYPVEKDAARGALSMPKDKTILLFLGSVTKWHGVEHLLAIASVLQGKSKDILIYIAGGHPATEEYIRSLAARAPDNVIFTGKVDADHANLYINAADICLLPVNQIRVSPGSPIKLFDYIAAGRPVVTQEDTTGYSDIVLSHKLGYALDFRESSAAADRILTIIDESRARDFVNHNRSVALTVLNWKNVAGQWNVFVDKVAKAQVH